MVKNAGNDANTGEKGKKDGKKLRILLRTFGCQMNERDSEIIEDMVSGQGFEVTQDIESADIVLFNTCSVRQHAEDRVTGNIQKLASRKRKDPDLRIGVLGCMAQRHGDLLLKEYPQVDMVVGPSNIYDIPDLLVKAAAGEKIVAVANKRRPVKKKSKKADHRQGAISAYVNIMYGCDNYCSYCIVPYVRGREVSRPKSVILKEVKSLVGRGFKEVTLLGQNVNSYGRGLTNKITFPELLEAVNGVRGIKRIRFVTSHSKDAGKSLFRAMRGLDKVCENLHLPLQSGSDKMLDLMNRGYKLEDYMKKIEMLREMVPDAGLSTDIIVGFPSEKERDYAATRKALEEIGFNSAFIFKYSPRPPALSSCLVDDVPERVKKERNNQLLALQKSISRRKTEEMVGTKQEILVEGMDRKSKKHVFGRTRNNTTCIFPGDNSLAGQLVRVRIKGASSYTLKGEAVKSDG